MAVSIFNKKNSPEWKIKRKNNQIRFYCFDSNFLEEKWDAIQSYSMKLGGKISGAASGRVFTPEKSRKGQIYVDLTDILPESVLLWYGKVPPRGVEANCHGAALVAAGTVPYMQFLRSPTAPSDCRFKEVKKEEVEPGDIIYFDTPHYLFSHSCVFIDRDLCIGMNGFQASLEIHSFPETKSMYDSTNLRYFRNEKNEFSTFSPDVLSLM